MNREKNEEIQNERGDEIMSYAELMNDTELMNSLFLSVFNISKIKQPGKNSKASKMATDEATNMFINKVKEGFFCYNQDGSIYPLKNENDIFDKSMKNENEKKILFSIDKKASEIKYCISVMEYGLKESGFMGYEDFYIMSNNNIIFLSIYIEGKKITLPYTFNFVKTDRGNIFIHRVSNIISVSDERGVDLTFDRGNKIFTERVNEKSIVLEIDDKYVEKMKENFRILYDKYYQESIYHNSISREDDMGTYLIH